MNVRVCTGLGALAIGMLAMVGCGETAPEEPACDVTLETLPGKTFVMAEAQPSGPDINNPMARMRFSGSLDALQMDYTAKAFSDVYQYTCKRTDNKKKDEIECLTKPKVKEACQALMVFEEHACTAEKLKEFFGEIGTPEEVEAAIKAAKDEDAQYRGKDTWKRYAAQKNSVGIPLQGQVFVATDPKRCRIMVSDLYRTIYEGQLRQDSNVVGTNAFVKDETIYAWEHCTDARGLLDLEADTLPATREEIPQEREYEEGKVVNYFYVGTTAVKAEPGCTYSADLIAQFMPVQQGVPANVREDGTIDWHFSHTYAAGSAFPLTPQRSLALYSVARNQTCNGETKRIDVVCNVATLHGAP